MVVGVNRYRDDADQQAIPIQRIPENLERDQIGRLHEHRDAQDAAAVRTGLDRVGAAAGGADNLMPAIIAAVEAGATLGSISGALGDVFGAHRPTDAN